MALTPMMQQYFQLKEAHPDCIIFFRLGDFYEMFFDDAILAARELELVLTGRDCGLEERAPMCGIPYHSAKNYIGRLVEKGYRVAICEQMEDPALTKGLVRRDIVKIITPGTLLDETFLKEDSNSYLMAAYLSKNESKKVVSLAITDITTGDFLTTTFDWDLEILKGEIEKFQPREVLLFDEDELFELFSDSKMALTLRSMAKETEEKGISGEFTVIEGQVPLQGKQVVLGLLAYLAETQKMSLSNLTKLVAYNVSDTMALDVNTRRNLELSENIVDKAKRGSLLWILDDTRTAMGARNLRRWVEKPLINLDQIQSRLEAVTSLYESLPLLEDLRQQLYGIYDLERLGAKVSQKAVNPKELLSLKNSLQRVPAVKDLLGTLSFGPLAHLGQELDDLSDVATLIENTLSEEAPVNLKDGDIIRSGFSDKVDELREIKRHGKEWISSLEAQEKEVTGISSLKIGYNKVFGYYIEIRKTNLSKIPEGRYVRKQTLANAERYITQELKEMEDKILGAEDRLASLEYELFAELRAQVEAASDRLKKVAGLLSDLDCYQSFAKVALDRNYVRPHFNQEGLIQIKQGRHPVVEAMIPRGEFIANDVTLDYKDNNFLLITGPNMAGKSTFMRQVALICLMAQVGSYVPCQKANLSLVDRIFTRIGASDDLSGGKSTFMVEMSEVSNILAHATHESLILLDEVGRGTSTYDGLSIAWAMMEYLMGEDGVKARGLFATHYHELIALEKELTGVKNFSVAVKRLGKDIVFLRKIIPGGADESYGVEVARLAGLPEELVDRAKEILLSLEAAGSKKSVAKRQEKLLQLSFQDFVLPNADPAKDAFIEGIKALPLNELTPLEALNQLAKLQKEAKEVSHESPN